MTVEKNTRKQHTTTRYHIQYVNLYMYMSNMTYKHVKILIINYFYYYYYYIVIRAHGHAARITDDETATVQ